MGYRGSGIIVEQITGVKHFSELYSKVDSVDNFFSLWSASDTLISIEGVLTVTLSLVDDVDQFKAVHVPLLITNVSGMNKPILGYNVIIFLLQNVKNDDVLQTLRCSLPTTEEFQVDAIYQEVADTTEGIVGKVKVGHRGLQIPAQSSVDIKVPFWKQQQQLGKKALFTPSPDLDVLGVFSRGVLVDMKPGYRGQMRLILTNLNKMELDHPRGTVLGQVIRVCSIVTFGDIDSILELKGKATVIQIHLQDK